MIAFSILMILPLCLALAAVSDLFTMTIPNGISIVLIAAFLVLAPVVGLEWPFIGMSLVAGLVVFLGCFGLFAMNIMGGGDAKLLTATSLWFGFNMPLVEFLVVVSFMGGMITLLVLFLRAKATTVLAMGVPLPASLVTENKIPYGIAIAIGGFATYEQAPIIQIAMRSLY